jgi:TatD DNase family protein
MSKPQIIDSHCHLNYEGLKENISEVIERAKEAQIKKIVSISTKLSEFDEIKKIVEDHGCETLDMFCSTGIHPCNVSDHFKEYSLKEISNALTENLKYEKCIAMGETGLDYYYSKESRDNQLESFDMHCDISVKFKKPLVVHTRDAEIDTIDILKNHDGNADGIIHCFTGSYDLAKKALDLGFLISLSGIITFKSAKDIQDTVKKLPLDRLLIETDAPFLAPQKNRGKKNEPSYIVETAKKLADLKNISFEEVAIATTNNFNNLFNLNCKKPYDLNL